MGRCCTRCHPRLFLRSLFETKAVVDHRLRLCVHINRDNRGSPGGGLSRWSWAAEGWTKRAPPGRPGHPTCRGLEGVTRRIGTMKGWSVYRGRRGGWSRDPTCKWCAFIVSKELRMNMWSGKWNKTREREGKREGEMSGGGVRSGAGLNENGNGRDRGWYLAPFRGKYDRKGEEDTNGKVERRLMIDDRRLLREQVG